MPCPNCVCKDCDHFFRRSGPRPVPVFYSKHLDMYFDTKANMEWFESQAQSLA